MRKLFVLLLLGILILSAVPLTTAQDGANAPVESNNMTIHVVQRDETLSQIALQYGITVDSIITANSIFDANSIQVGQRLIIPNPQVESPGMIITHVVQPGETLSTIATRYNSTLDSLSTLNYIANSNSLYVGENIQVAQGATGSLPYELVSLRRVQPGDYWFALAAEYQIPAARLAEINGLDMYAPLQVGQALIIPDTDSAGRFVNLPLPMTDFQLSPLPATQGQTLSAAVITGGNSQVTGRILDRDIQFTQDGNTHHAMIGLHAFTTPGIYALQMQITDEAGRQSSYEARVYVQDGSYTQEVIEIPEDRQNLLATEVVQAELDRVSAVMSGFTSERFFGGLMSLPSTGPVTSRFGTRRSYNGSGYDTFHGGTDFGGAPGSLVLAAAAGTVVLAEPLNVRGNAIIIDHGWGVYTGYWHLTQIYVANGQLVQRGDPIGTLGSTGLVTGAHLHWEMWVGGVQVDPLQWLSNAFFSSPSPE